MKHLIMSGLAFATAASATGCIIDDSSDTGDAAVTWTTLTADLNGNPVSAACPAGATTAVIYALPEGATVEPYEDRYLCGDGAGGAADLPAGRYTVWVRLTDDALATRYAESASQVVDVVAGNTTSVPAYGIFVDHGFYQLSWNLRPPGSSGPVACSTIAGENGVSIVATDGGGALLDTVVDCEEGLAPAATETRPLPVGGSYTIAVSVLNASDQSIGDAAPIAPSEAGPLDYGNKYQDLGIIEIDRNWL